MAAVEGHEFGVAVDTAPELVIPNVPIEKFQLELELPLEEFSKVMPIGLMPLATSGGAAASGPSALGSIADLLIGSDGVVYVLDHFTRVVQVFDQTGTHLRSIGSEGQGPGELGRPIALAWGPDD